MALESGKYYVYQFICTLSLSSLQRDYTKIVPCDTFDAVVKWANILQCMPISPLLKRGSNALPRLLCLVSGRVTRMPMNTQSHKPKKVGRTAALNLGFTDCRQSTKRRRCRRLDWFVRCGINLSASLVTVRVRHRYLLATFLRVTRSPIPFPSHPIMARTWQTRHETHHASCVQKTLCPQSVKFLRATHSACF